MRLLVTGGAGFIGSNFVQMVATGELPGISKMIVLDKLTYAGNIENINHLPDNSYEFVLGDISDPEMVTRLISKSDVVVNFAAESHVDRSINNSYAFTHTNILGTQVLLEASRKSNIKTFIQVSTDEVYGSIPIGSSKESDPLLPNSPYAASKAASDLISRAFHKTYEVDVRITRCSNNYGPFQFPEKIIPLFITNLIENKSVPLYGTGLNVREWLHVTDHCRGIHSAIINGRAGEIYNFGSGKELTNIELTNQIIKIMGFDESKIEKVADRLGHDFRYSLDTSKSMSELKFVPQVSWDSGLQKTIDWYMNNEHWWRKLKK